MENIEELKRIKKELEEQINEFVFPLFYSQVIKREELIKELNIINAKIKYLEIK